MDKNKSSPEKKKTSSDRRKKETAEAAEKAANAGIVSRIFVKLGQKVGYVEQTKLSRRFHSNIDKLVSYHNAIFSMVDHLEAQVQIDPVVLQQNRVTSPEGQNPWEMLGGWLYFLALTQFEGAEAKTLEKFSCACGKIAARETNVQMRTRTHLLKKMEAFIQESAELNTNVDNLMVLLDGIDDSRHKLKSSQTVKELMVRGEEYRSFIRAFNDKAAEIQAHIDELVMVVSLHQNDFLKFARELHSLHDHTYNLLTEVFIRLGHDDIKPSIVPKKPRKS